MSKSLVHHLQMQWCFILATMIHLQLSNHHLLMFDFPTTYGNHRLNRNRHAWLQRKPCPATIYSVVRLAFRIVG